jgi:hypothetical protein
MVAEWPGQLGLQVSEPFSSSTSSHFSGNPTSLTMSALSSPFFFFFTTFFAHLSIHSEEWSSLFSVDLCIDDHGSLVIFRSASVRPKHLFDPYFDHDY